MKAGNPQKNHEEISWLSVHPLDEEDSVVASGLRTATAGAKGRAEGTAARGPFDGIIKRAAAPEGVTFEADGIGGIPGWWAKPRRAKRGSAMLHFHGGWFNWGRVQAYRNLVGQIALRDGVDAFIPDYRLAPENPFPAAVLDVENCYRGMIDKGVVCAILYYTLFFAVLVAIVSDLAPRSTPPRPLTATTTPSRA